MKLHRTEAYCVADIGWAFDPKDKDWIIFYLDEAGRREPIVRVRRQILEMAAGESLPVNKSPAMAAMGEAVRDLVAAAYRAAGVTVTEVDVEPSPDTN